MRKFIVLLILLGLGYLGYVIWQDVEKKRAVPPAEQTPVPTFTPAPTPAVPPAEPEARYAPEGVLFVVKRFSETRDGGVRGFSEGKEVRLVRAEAGYYVVTDGEVEARRPRSWFTRDMALARDLRDRRAVDQTRLQQRLAEERALFERRENERAARWSGALDSIEGPRMAPRETAAAAAAATRPGLAPLRIGAWNLEFFGNRQDPPRTDADVQAVAEFIKGLGVQALAVCEVNGEKPLKDLCRRIGPSWRYVAGRSGQLGEQGQITPGFLWDNSRLELLSAGELQDLRQGPLFHRVPVMAAFKCRAGGPDFRMVAVHLKAGREAEDFERREGELQALRGFLAKLAADASEDDDIVVVGDFNHDPSAAEADILSEGAFASFLTRANAGRSIIHFNRQIDHIVPLGTFEEVETGSFTIHNKEGMRDPDAWRRVYSDHFPVTADLAALPDDDPQAKLGAQGKRLR